MLRPDVAKRALEQVLLAFTHVPANPMGITAHPTSATLCGIAVDD